MVWSAVKILIASVTIAFTSWLADRRPGLAGFLTALPLFSMLALVFNFAEYRDPAKSSAFAKSIFLAVPLSLLFFIPFLIGDKLKLSFPILFALGIVFLAIAYGTHSSVFR